jgi:rod shape-determining protein MreB
MLIGESTAENIKKTIGSAFPGKRDGSEGQEPRRRHSTLLHVVNEILGAHRPLNSIVSAVKSALEQTPPDWAPISPKRAWCSPVARCCAQSPPMEETDCRSSSQTIP